MKTSLKRYSSLAALLLLITGCASMDSNFYRIDLRSHDVPIMVSADSASDAGRPFRIVVTQGNTVSTNVSSGYSTRLGSYTEYSTTSDYSVSSVSLDEQLWRRIDPDDNMVGIQRINFFGSFLGAPFYASSTYEMSVDLTFHRGDLGEADQ